MNPVQTGLYLCEVRYLASIEHKRYYSTDLFCFEASSNTWSSVVVFNAPSLKKSPVFVTQIHLWVTVLPLISPRNLQLAMPAIKYDILYFGLALNRVWVDSHLCQPMQRKGSKCAYFFLPLSKLWLGNAAVEEAFLFPLIGLKSSSSSGPMWICYETDSHCFF